MTTDGLSPVERRDYVVKIEQLRQQNVVPSRGFLNLYGYTESGDLVLAPDSFSQGYQDAFLLLTQRPSLVFNFLGLFGQLSSGRWIFIPSYNRGLSYGVEQLNILKFATLVEGERILFRELQVERQLRQEMEKQLKESQERIKDLNKRFEAARRNVKPPKDGETRMTGV